VSCVSRDSSASEGNRERSVPQTRTWTCSPTTATRATARRGTPSSTSPRVWHAFLANTSHCRVTGPVTRVRRGHNKTQRPLLTACRVLSCAVCDSEHLQEHSRILHTGWHCPAVCEGIIPTRFWTSGVLGMWTQRSCLELLLQCGGQCELQ